MFPNSSNLGCSPFHPKHQQQNIFFNKLPINIAPTLLSNQQIIDAQIGFQNAALSRDLLSVNLATAVTPQTLTYGNGSPVHTSSAPVSFRGRKRLSEQSVPYDVKRQRFDSPHHETTVVNLAVPLPEEHTYSFPSSTPSPLFNTRYVPDLSVCVPPLQDSSFPYVTETTLPVAEDKLSQQVLELFQLCQQQTSDLNKKELCRIELQREIQRIFPKSRLFLVGSSLNGFGTRSSDGDLCLVVKDEPVNQKTEARHMLSLVQKLFTTKLSCYIERPQLIRAKVPIVKFRDKVSCMEFDLNVNNIVGIRNTFLLRTYAYTLPEPILPSLQKKYPESFDPTMQLHLVHQVPCTIPPYLSKNESSLGDLLIGFFKYYATEFDWSHQMISVREAKAIPRPDGIAWRNKFICIEEPFDGTNTARAVHEKQKFDFIKDEFFRSWQMLRNKKNLNSILPLRAALQKK
ncbi:poly(A) RNA polymerase GLD2 isoform X3 [Cygnus atratus]|uniref:poly(A) RNA polymerase GLD2 isoform X3 n=1 Tax=Cygnus atratus TaxID=8868 RepID=UPI0015D5BCBE|nr:poly(A) RNA polymerase GLD2 isoform X3 [Cygnus atratus]XP_035409440.1 poly(A) RNA polymerase GLD2 isoform X3 [Cygnus atratus]